MDEHRDRYRPLDVVGWKWKCEEERVAYGLALVRIVLLHLESYLVGPEHASEREVVYRAILYFGASTAIQQHFLMLVGEECVRQCVANCPQAEDRRTGKIF